MKAYMIKNSLCQPRQPHYRYRSAYRTWARPAYLVDTTRPLDFSAGDDDKSICWPFRTLCQQLSAH